jgi:hypothetical protein
VAVECLVDAGQPPGGEGGVSASVETMISPRASSLPRCRAWHTPRSGSNTTVAPAAEAIQAVRSVLLLSTTMISNGPG